MNDVIVEFIDAMIKGGLHLHIHYDGESCMNYIVEIIYSKEQNRDIWAQSDELIECLRIAMCRVAEYSDAFVLPDEQKK